MVVDSSAIVAILLGEPEAEVFRQLTAEAPQLLISAVSILEATLVLESRLAPDAGIELDVLLHAARFEVVPFDGGQLAAARRAWRKFGKGNHPAGLNMGDCASYALSKTTGEPLLFKGNDFSKTDIVPALGE